MELLQITIEKVRLSLYETAKGKALTDPEVIRMSQLLDSLLNEYRRAVMMS
ncbi:aspartyl-phosphate phosphatase Spo0E family protein [Desulfitobacterium sp.]|uniref:aspartyl-phosphate phosphatase Spo0E family protein n=1 Tax=Desulfitobacterium sp. TaxID=49981 RepID=UPI002BFCC416|nr:aspartyl-phosphate phosphatase Spo0E family protein [Desulfitobacterium sp.]HVJ50654.1 aspartyl-phosphate phosphatase Spo0E family protein [Desulfitobacterium sp.]